MDKVIKGIGSCGLPEKEGESRRLQDLLRREVPELRPIRMKVLAFGHNRTTVEVNGTHIFRFPRETDARSVTAEIQVLNALKDRVDLDIPRIQFTGTSMKYFGYPKVQGEPLPVEDYRRLTPRAQKRLAQDLALFLHQLHQTVPVRRARSWGLGVITPSFQVRGIAPWKRRTTDVDLRGRVDRALRRYQQRFRHRWSPSVIFADLFWKNIAFDRKTQRVRGVFDFGDVAVGDRHLEFIPWSLYDSGLMEEMFAAYQTLTPVPLSRAQLETYIQLHWMRELAFFASHPSSPAFSRAAARVRELLK